MVPMSRAQERKSEEVSGRSQQLSPGPRTWRLGFLIILRDAGAVVRGQEPKLRTWRCKVLQDWLTQITGRRLVHLCHGFDIRGDGGQETAGGCSWEAVSLGTGGGDLMVPAHLSWGCDPGDRGSLPAHISPPGSSLSQLQPHHRPSACLGSKHQDLPPAPARSTPLHPCQLQSPTETSSELSSHPSVQDLGSWTPRSWVSTREPRTAQQDALGTQQSGAPQGEGPNR